METRSIYDYCAILWRRRVLVLLLTALATAAGYGLSFLQPPVYESYIVFYHAGALIPTGTYQGVAPELWAWRNVLIPPAFQERKYSYEGLLNSGAVRSRVHKQVPEKPEAELERDVQVFAAPNHMIYVRVRDRDAGVAARIATGYRAALDELLSEIGRPYRQHGLASARVALDRASQALVHARGELQTLLESAGTANLDRSVEDSLVRRIYAASQLDEARAALRALDRRIEVAEDRLRSESGWILPGAQAAHGETFRRLLDEFEQLEEEQAEARERGEPGASAVELRARLEQKKQALSEEMEGRVTQSQRHFAGETASFQEQLRQGIVQAYVERVAFEAAIAAKQQSIRELESTQVGFPALRLDEALLRADVKRLERMVDLAALHYEEVRGQLMEQPSHLVVQTQSWPANWTLLPTPRANAWVAGFLGLLGGVYASCALEFLRDRRLRGAA